MKKTLYHYTDFMAFDGILRNSELRVNNVLNMNDAEEMKFFMRKIREAVIERLKKNGYEKRISCVEELFDEAFENEFIYSAYAACFSIYRDDASQWERYGNLGRGVCIGMNGEMLGRMCGKVLKLEKVFYQNDVKNNYLVNNFVDLLSGEKEPEQEEAQKLINEAWAASVAYKHPSFACEHEVRLLVLPFTQEYFEIRPQYHVSTERIKKYYPINLKHACEIAGCTMDELIREIIIGPESTQSLPILQDYLKDQGLGSLAEKVVISECPLRRTLK